MWPPSRSDARSESSRLTSEPGRGLGQRGAPQRLVHHLGAELAVGDRRRGQADAVDGDRVALGDLPRQPRAHAQRHAVARGVDGGDRPEVLDEPGEHGHHSRSRARDQHVVGDPLDVERQRARRLGDPLDALALERVARVGAADHDRREEQADLVDLARVEERARELRPALEQDRGDAGRAELVERRAHARGLVLARRDDHVGAGDLERVGLQPRGGAADDDGERQLGRAAHELGVERQPPLGVEHDAARLARRARRSAR